jgi:hypothetical protein
MLLLVFAHSVLPLPILLTELSFTHPKLCCGTFRAEGFIPMSINLTPLRICLGIFMLETCPRL